jgi:hypothetical protein
MPEMRRDRGARLYHRPPSSPLRVVVAIVAGGGVCTQHHACHHRMTCVLSVLQNKTSPSTSPASRITIFTSLARCAMRGSVFGYRRRGKNALILALAKSAQIFASTCVLR